MRTLIAGVGYHNLRDLSIGPMLVAKLKQLDWRANVEIDDLSFGPIAVVQRLQDQPCYYDRVVFVAGVQRGRAPGQIFSYHWDSALPSKDEIQQRIGEAVTGVVSLDNLLIIAQHFGVLPRDVRVVEVEPADTSFGLELTPRIEAVFDQVIQAVKNAALETSVPA
ncbi:MAG: hydrogenase maturation protease [Chloroflexi bacterium]|nr:hydrogenase maturation protease [Chloroflexota bacterium]